MNNVLALGNSGLGPSGERSAAKSRGSPGENQQLDELALGIDIEFSESLPALDDPFYAGNFTAAEIAHCLRQHNPKQSFIRFWSAKEAAMKCGVEFAGLSPIEIEIMHEETGRPVLYVAKEPGKSAARDCLVSISYARGVSVAVCIKQRRDRDLPRDHKDQGHGGQGIRITKSE